MTLWCIGRNYAAHAKELGNAVPAEPVVFLKAGACLRGLEPAPMGFEGEAYHHELELVLRLGRDLQLGEDPGWGAVDAVALGLDLTRRQAQAACKAQGLPWTIAKSFAGSAVVAPFVPLAQIPAPDALRFWLDVEGERRQEGGIADALFSVPAILAHLAAWAPLRAGDLVFTGTPPGVADVRVGQRFRLGLVADVERTWDGTL